MTATEADAGVSAGEAAADRAFFGHPKGLPYLLGAEIGWAFAYFGLQNVLTLYMTQTLLKPGHAEHVLGLAAYRSMLQGLYGPLSSIGVASQTFGMATGLIYALPILGGLLADRWIGQRKAVTAGVLVLAVAFVLLIYEQTFLIALALMMMGAGLTKTSLISQLGGLYAPGDDRRSRAFGLYLIALNVGSMVTPLVSGTLGERLGWRYGFMTMAVGMALGALCYVAGTRHMPPDRRSVRPANGEAAGRVLRPGDGRVIAILALLMLADGIFGGVYNQAFDIFPVWAEAHVERHISGFLAPVTWFNTLDGIMTIVGTALAVRVWAWQTGRSGKAKDVQRIAIGFAMTTVAFLLLAFSSGLGGGGKAPLAPEVGFFILVDFAIPWIDTVVLTLVSRDAPASINTSMIGVYYLFVAAGNFLTGWLGGLSDRLSMPGFWLMHAAIAGALLLLLVLAGTRLDRGLTASQTLKPVEA